MIEPAAPKRQPQPPSASLPADPPLLLGAFPRGDVGGTSAANATVDYNPISASELWQTIQLMELLFVNVPSPVQIPSLLDIENELDAAESGEEIDPGRRGGRGPLRLAGHAPLFVSLMLGALIFVEVARASLTLLGGSLSRVPPGPLPVSTAPPPGPRPIDVHGIVASHLFGVVVNDANAQNSARTQQSPANLSLAGTLATEDPNQGIAIISDGGRAMVYKVGDEVAGGSLRSVYRDHVVLRRPGGLESLILPRVRLPNGEGGRAVSRTAKADAGDSSEDGRSAGDFIRGSASVGPGGKLKGFRVFPAGDRQIFDESGLHGGDLVVAVNGIPLEDQDRQAGQSIFDSIKTSSQATMTIESAGQRRDVTINGAR